MTRQSIRAGGKKIPAQASPEQASAARSLTLAFCLLVVTTLCYAPAWHGQPVWDDAAHMTKPELRSVRGLERIWLEPGATQQYYPLVHSVFWVEHQLFGDAVLPYHLLSILLHVAGALLLVKILQELKIRGAWLAGAIFALHPVQVESVAWISELKNTLSGVFFFSALLLYLRFDRIRRLRGYFVALALFAAGLLCKSVIATLPAVLLVLFWWKRGKVSGKKDALPLIPFFAAGIGAGLFTAWVERRFIGAQGEAFDFTLIERCLIAGRAFWFYLGKLCWPADLIFIYPRWQISIAQWWQYLFPFTALVLLGAAFVARKRSRSPLAALLLFAGMLFPALGFFNVYPFIFSFVADHFQYLASSAVIAAFAAGLSLVGRRYRISPALRYSAVTALLATLATLTWRQSRIFANAEALYRTTLERNPACWMADNNLGLILLGQGDVDKAASHFENAIVLKPNYAEAHNNLGNAFAREGRLNEAMAQYQKALAIRPVYAAPHANLGGVLIKMKRINDAFAELQVALQMNPRDSEAQNNMGNALLEMGRVSEAIPHYAKAVELSGDHSNQDRAKAECNLAIALSRNGQLDDAIVHYQRALEFEPNYADAHGNLGTTLLAGHQVKEALAHYEKAVELAPDSILFQNQLAWQLATCADPQFRNGAKAVSLAERANQLSGGKDPLVLNTLAAAYAQDGQFTRAVETARDALDQAEAAGDTALIDLLRHAIDLYEVGSPYEQTAP